MSARISVCQRSRRQQPFGHVNCDDCIGKLLARSHDLNCLYRRNEKGRINRPFSHALAGSGREPAVRHLPFSSREMNRHIRIQPYDIASLRKPFRVYPADTLAEIVHRPHLFAFPVAFMVYFSPTQVTLVSNPEVNPIWYPTEKAKAVANTTNAKVSKKSTNPPKIPQNFPMAPPFIGARLFHSPPSCFMIRSKLR